MGVQGGEPNRGARDSGGNTKKNTSRYANGVPPPKSEAQIRVMRPKRTSPALNAKGGAETTDTHGSGNEGGNGNGLPPQGPARQVDFRASTPARAPSPARGELNPQNEFFIGRAINGLANSFPTDGDQSRPAGAGAGVGRGVRREREAQIRRVRVTSVTKKEKTRQQKKGEGLERAFHTPCRPII